jgi:hypothetical protein
MVYPHSGSQLTVDGRNTTRTALSTSIIIQVDNNPIGAIESLSVNETRTVGFIDEVGTDGHIDSAPSKATEITGSCKRTRFDGLRIAAAFSRGFVHVSAQRIPFDILILDLSAAEENDQGFMGADGVVTTVIKNVWIKKIGYSYTKGDYHIAEDLDWEAETIYSFMGSGNSVVPASFARQLPIIDNDVFERQADMGFRRGALDAAGLINVVASVAANS